MRHRCEHCNTLWKIPDHVVTGKRLKVRCTRCAQNMWVLGPGALLAPPPLPPRGPYFYNAGTKVYGPVTGARLLVLARDRKVNARTYVYSEGLGRWQRVVEAPRLRWLYDEVVTSNIIHGWPQDELFTRSALISDGNGYFPDPTLKSGLILLDQCAQDRLHALAAKNGLVPRAPRRQRWAASLAAAAAVAMLIGAGIGTAAYSLGWADTIPPLSSVVGGAFLSAFGL
jgi:predicted Zn finger-like uncharacterized protein